MHDVVLVFGYLFCCPTSIKLEEENGFKYLSVIREIQIVLMVIV